ncbi:MAG: DUF6056 family protein, partial [Eubacteriales bacterium]|nr:DUF6056 family protein [Eubacteriales bacterium]
LACLTLAQVLPLNYNRYQEAANRATEVIAQRDAGNLNPVTYNISGKSPYDAFYEMSDIADDATFWSNEFYAKYYGLESVVINELR